MSRFLVPVITLSLVLTLACQREEQLYSGTYLLQDTERPGASETYIELRENGVGIWATPDDEVPLRWDIKDGKIRLHTKLGGVLIGTIQGDTLEIVFPNSKIRRFNKQGKS